MRVSRLGRVTVASSLVSAVKSSAAGSLQSARKAAGKHSIIRPGSSFCAHVDRKLQTVIERVGPIFWLQDRIEEIVLWRKGWKLTSTWIAGYAFFCYFPRLLFLLPQMIIIGIILATHPETTLKPPPAPEAPAESGSVDWQANIQAIQNPMGFILTSHQPQTANPRVFPVMALVSLPAFPVRIVCLLLGYRTAAAQPPHHPRPPPQLLRPGARSHRSKPRGNPTARQGLRQRLRVVAPVLEVAGGVRLIDDANLTDECWVAEKREVELFENERFGGDDTHKEWSKANLRDGERTGWTRGGTGGAASGQGGVSSNLTFSLDPGWAFVTTEDWRADLEARRARQGGARTADDEGVAEVAEVADDDGWMYTNDVWTAHRPPSPSYSPSVGGVTRRRRYCNRGDIYAISSEDFRFYASYLHAMVNTVF
ncbi:hypothetical protein DFH06DRAFT_1123863 [Mycena polygramma]|nr:hypothetical protein DFH06DRAFT_1123863 [Mycena polygramma]